MNHLLTDKYLQMQSEKYKDGNNIENMIHCAITTANYQLFLLYVDKEKYYYSTKTMDLAAKHGSLDIVIWLHKNRFEGCTKLAMINAAMNGHQHIIEWLHNNREEGCNEWAINFAAMNGHHHIIEWLHNNRTEGYSIDAIKLAIRNGHYETIKWLFDHSKKEYDKREFISEIRIASNYGYQDIVKYLIVDKKFKFNCEAMDNAIQNKHYDLAKFLSEHGGEVRYGINWCAYYNNMEFLKYLIDKYYNILDDKYYSDYLINAAFRNGTHDTAMWLIDNYNVPISKKSIQMAIRGGNIESVKYLLEKSNSIDYYDPNELDIPVSYGYKEICEEIYNKYNHRVRFSHSSCIYFNKHNGTGNYLETIQWVDDIGMLSENNNAILLGAINANQKECYEYIESKYDILNNMSFNKLDCNIDTLEWIYNTLTDEKREKLFSRYLYEYYVYSDKIEHFIWLVTHDSNFNQNKCFEYAIKYNNFPIVKWLYQNYKLHVSINSLIYGKAEENIIQFLYKYGMIDDESRYFVKELDEKQTKNIITIFNNYMPADLECIDNDFEEMYYYFDCEFSDGYDYDGEEFTEKIISMLNDGTMTEKFINVLLEYITTNFECGASLNVIMIKEENDLEFTVDQIIAMTYYNVTDDTDVPYTDVSHRTNKIFGYGVYRMGKYLIVACGTSV